MINEIRYILEYSLQILYFLPSTQSSSYNIPNNTPDVEFKAPVLNADGVTLLTAIKEVWQQ